MKAIAAIIEPAPIDMELLSKQLSVALAEERQAETSAARHEQQAAAARETARVRRLEIGLMLVKARGAWPNSGPKAKGWGVFLAEHKLDDSTAWRYMDDAKKNTRKLVDSSQAPELRGNSDDEPGPTREDDQTGPRIVPDPDRPRETPQFRQPTESDVVQMIARLDPEAQKRILRAGKANVNGASGEKERGGWCTPKPLAIAVGPWDVDPFSNPRSHVLAAHRCQLEDSGNGFGDGSGPGSYRVSNRPAEYAGPETRVWIQPPYERGFVRDVVDHYKHTRFCALLRWSPDVDWFAALWPHVRVVAFPIGARLEFEPPPGVEPTGDGGAPFPHALLYADERDVTDEVRAMCIVWRVDHSSDPATVTPIDPPLSAA